MFLRGFSFSELNDSESIQQFVYDFVTGDSYMHLYFIAVVIQFYIIFPLIQQFNSRKQLFWLTMVSLFINYFYLTAKPDIGSGIIHQLTQERAFLLNWIFYFFLGGLLVHLWKPLIKYIKENLVFVAMLCMIPIFFMTYEYISNGLVRNSTRPANLMYVPVFFVSIVSVYYLLDKYKRFRNVVLEIGNMSMGIYLVHPLVIYFIRNDAAWLFERTRWIALGYILTVLISILIVKLVHKLPFGQYIVIIAGKKKSRPTSIRSKKVS